MNRYAIWGSIVFLAMSVLSGIWFINNFEYIDQTEELSEHEVALRNPYLAAERFFESQHLTTHRLIYNNELSQLPARGFLFFGDNRDAYLTPVQIDAISAWLQRGGCMMTMPDTGSDPLLERLKTSSYDAHFGGKCTPKSGGDTPIPSCDEEDTEEAEEAGDAEDSDTAASKKKNDAKKEANKNKLPEDKFTTVNLGNKGQYKLGLTSATLFSEYPLNWQGFIRNRETIFSAALQFNVGRGQVTVVDSLHYLMRNRYIGELDHADFIWTVVNQCPNQPTDIYIMSEGSNQKLLSWLWTNAKPALACLALLLLLLLWRFMPRFAVMVVNPPPGSHALSAHLSAIGRYLWRQGGLNHWLNIARQHLYRLLGRHIIDFPQKSAAQQVELLSNTLTMPAATIESALHGSGEDPVAFTRIMQELHTIEQHFTKEFR